MDSEDANNRLTTIILVLVMSIWLGGEWWCVLPQGAFTVLSIMSIPRL